MSQHQATFESPRPRAEWESENPFLTSFQFAQESEEPYGVKVGPGYWNDLSYIANSGIKVYRATLTQTGTGAPTPTVEENTLGGTLVWTRSSAGVYVGTLSDAFPDDTKTWCSCTYGNNNNDLATDGFSPAMYWGSIHTVILEAIAVDGTRADLNCNGASVGIIVYP